MLQQKYFYFLILLLGSIPSTERSSFAAEPTLKQPRVIMDLSTRPIDHRNDSLWTPDQRMVDKLESHLEVAIAKHAKLERRQLAAAPSQYGRQYQGVVQAQRRLIYINGFCDSHDLSESKLNLQFIDVMDGGTCYFQALYDPKIGEFVSFHFNGEA